MAIVTPHPLQVRYDALWTGASARIGSGAADIDPLLASGQPDRRRGLTLLFRPSAQVIQNLLKLLGDIHHREPEQYYYQDVELHATFLTLFTAVVDSARFFARQAEYLEATRAAVDGLAPFKVTFRGVTASPAAILIQGFPQDGALEAGREALRKELRARGLTEGLDTRYKLETAHMTVVRFRHALRQPTALVEFLKSRRDLDFGTVQIRELSLLNTDWYMSRSVMKEISRYRLP